MLDCDGVRVEDALCDMLGVDVDDSVCDEELL